MSIVDLLVSLLLLHLLCTSAITFGRGAVGLVRLQEAKREAMQTNFLALDMFARELRVAGYSALGEKLDGIALARNDALDLRADLDGDGATTGLHERIAYGWDESRRAVMRATQQASPQPWLPNVPPGGFILTYLGHRGETIISTQPHSSEIAAVRLQLRTEWNSTLPRPNIGGEYRVCTVTVRRNP